MMNAPDTPGYARAVSLLDGFVNHERTPPLSGLAGYGTERMAALSRGLGNPHLAYEAVHVAGTKGKGSIAHLVASALTRHGFSAGLYTSPHVNHLRERICVNGRPVSEDGFADAFRKVYPVADAMRAAGGAPSYFEVLTAVAFTVFRDAGVDAAVAEVGLGGRLDATNLPDLRVAASGIGTISLDHQDILGSGLESIAFEKAGIMRRGVPVLIGRQNPGIASLFKKWAGERGVPFLALDADVSFGPSPGTLPADRPDIPQLLDFRSRRGTYRNIPLAMLGEHQAANAAMALGLLELFMEKRGRLPDRRILGRAWRGLSLPGRLEVMASRPWLVVDGGHNAASAWAAAKTVRQRFSAGSRTLVFAAAGDKDIPVMLRILLPLADRAVFTSFSSPRAADPRALLARAERECGRNGAVKASVVAADPAEALRLARRDTPADGLILVTGSLYLAGEARAIVEAGNMSTAAS